MCWGARSWNLGTSGSGDPNHERWLEVLEIAFSDSLPF